MEAFCAALGIAGSLLNIYKNKWGFACWFVGNILWVGYGIKTQQYYFAGQYLFFTLLSIWGFTKWSSIK
jgi:nicotinamide riboside transporter PnuC